MIWFRGLSNCFANARWTKASSFAVISERAPRSHCCIANEIGDLCVQSLPVSMTTAAMTTATMSTTTVAAATNVTATMAPAHVPSVATHMSATAMHATAEATAVTTAAMPAAPTLWAAPTETATIRVAAPVKAGTTPAIEIEAVIPAAGYELGLFNRADIGCSRTKLRHRHRLCPTRHPYSASGCSAQDERQPKLPHRVLTGEC